MSVQYTRVWLLRLVAFVTTSRKRPSVSVPGKLRRGLMGWVKVPAGYEMASVALMLGHGRLCPRQEWS